MSRRYSKNNKEKIKKKYLKRQIIFERWKEKYGCQLCNRWKYGYHLELHHFYNKKFQLGSPKFNLLKSKDIIFRRKVIREIKKCILVCAFCHKDIERSLYSQKQEFEIYIKFQNKIKNWILKEKQKRMKGISEVI